MPILATGHPCHTRMLEVELLAGEPGKLRARGNVVDLRKMGFVPMMSDIQSTGFVHHMQIDLDVDAQTRVVEEIEIRQPYVAIEASEQTGGECCRDPKDLLLGLKGQRLVPGFEREVSRLFGGPLGCSHLLTLGQTIGRALPSAIEREHVLLDQCGTLRSPGERAFKRTVFIDGLCSADRSEMQLALALNDQSSAPFASVEVPLDRLDVQHEVHAHTTVKMDGMTLGSLHCEERRRSLADAGKDSWNEWSDRTAETSELVRQRIMPGLGGRLISMYAERPERRLVLDALLHLAPGFLQCVAALSDGWMGAGKSPPSHATLGGMQNACYMWREEGILDRRRQEYAAQLTNDVDASGTAEGSE